MPSLSDVENFRAVLADLDLVLVEDLTALWRELDGEAPDVIEAVLQGSVPEVLTPYIAGSSELAAAWYGELADSTFTAVPSPLPPTEQVQASVRWATGPLYGRGAAPVLDLLTGAAKRYVLGGARTTLVDNATREGVTWARHASANACAFCRMLATRGAVYSSEAAAGKVVGRGTEMSLSDRRHRAAGETRGYRGRFLAGGTRTRGPQQRGDRYHDNCRCLPVPVRAGDVYVPPAYVEDWQKQYEAATRETPGVGPHDAVDRTAVLAHMRRTGRTK